MDSVSIGLDVGGTFTKGAIFYSTISENVNVTEVYYYDSKSNSPKEEVLENFVFIIKDLLTNFREIKRVSSIGLAFPGPFDYDQGISMIRNLRKFNSIFGINLKRELVRRLIEYNSDCFCDTNIFFMNDAQAFAIGENKFSGCEKGAYFTIGTGCGSTFLENGECVQGKYGIPHSGMVYDEQFLDGKIDQYISENGLKKIATEFGFSDMSGKELFFQAEIGVSQALQIFESFGVNIGRAICPYIKTMEPNEVVFGGQVSKSFKFFNQGVLRTLSDARVEKIDIRSTLDTTVRTLEGLNEKMKRGKK
ncbi:ROK family protein [Vagococcus elongatus]|uniref:ROK family protein n=1 Tax=Vagococcus elongatus TaxID=180344 RepID=A0A430B256_9ENTE|nr:ROK family protein [Vagococcus elongatus]RSU14388.1 hypothetical protein CBF29_03570 [Vagococcus elongatus]